LTEKRENQSQVSKNTAFAWITFSEDNQQISNNMLSMYNKS